MYSDNSSKEHADMTELAIPPKALERLPWLADREKVQYEYDRGTIGEVASKYSMAKRTFTAVLNYHMIEKRAKGVPPPFREVGANEEITCRNCPERDICFTPGHICVCVPERKLS